MSLGRSVFYAISVLIVTYTGTLRAQKAPTAIKPVEVRVVVVANFENGADTGDAPGEYQFWVESERLDEKVPVRGAPDVVCRNKEGLYSLCLRHGVTDLAAFVLDPRFDLHKTYWLFTGISGVDPRAARVGRVAPSKFTVTSPLHRQIPQNSEFRA